MSPTAQTSRLLRLPLLLLPLLLLPLLLPARAAADPGLADFLESFAVDPAVAVNCSAFALPLRVTADSAHGLRQRLLLRAAPQLLADRAAALAAAAAAAAEDENSSSCHVVSALTCCVKRPDQQPRQQWWQELQAGCVRARSDGRVEFDGVDAGAAAVDPYGLPHESASACAARKALELVRPALSASRSRRSVDADADLAAGVRRFVSKMPQLQRLVRSARTSDAVRRITQRGFETFSSSASLQAIEQVEPARYSEFADFLLDSLDVSAEARAQIRRGVFDLMLMAGSTEWQDFKMLFKAGRGGNTKYVNILAHKGAGGFDFVVADFRTTFSLAPNLVVVEKSSSSMWGAFGSSETVIRRVPASITDADVEALMNFFDLAAFRRFAEMLQVPLHRRQRRSVMGAIAVVNAGVETYSKFAKAFSTKRTSRIVGKIVGKGFDHFAMSSRVHVISRLQANYLDWYLSRVHRLYGLPRNREVRDVLQLIRFAGFQEWNKNDFLFDVGSGGRNAWVTILANKNRDGTYNFLVAQVRQTFKLAPNVLIIKKSKSVAGGIYQSEKFEFKRMPRSITEADLQMLMNFFNIVTFKRFGMRLGVDTSKLNG